MYKIEINNIKKTFYLTFSGIFTPDEVDNFLKEYSSKVSSIPSNEYKLVADTTNLRVSKQEMLPLMKNCIALYMQTPFQKRYAVEGDSIITNMQMKRVCSEANADIHFIKNTNEI
ncbi:MAG: hypothetical protein Q8900_10830 [Bacillota bacterium]|nr:hypothetical protein [Bacillota bacterium]